VSGWTRYRFVGQHGCDLLVTRTGKVRVIDALHDRRCHRVGGELMEPGAGGRLGWVRMGSVIGDQVAVGGTTTEPPTGLGVGSNGIGDT
jgi:hypothetical protein